MGSNEYDCGCWKGSILLLLVGGKGKEGGIIVQQLVVQLVEPAVSGVNGGGGADRHDLEAHTHTVTRRGEMEGAGEGGGGGGKARTANEAN